MAFNEKNLLAPIWQRTANNVLSTDIQTPEESQLIINNEERPIDENQFEEIDHSNNVFLIVDPLVKGSNENKQEQYLIILDNNQSMPDKSKLMLAITSKRKK
jgi:hypothetical protein